LLKVLGISLSALALASLATAGTKPHGISEMVSKVTFVAPTRLGAALFPAGGYVVRHTMEGQQHIMVFQPLQGRTPEVKVKCTLVLVAQKTEHSHTIYTQNAGNKRALQE
jgi:hypothetical protein